MENVLNDESENTSLSQLLSDIPTQQLILEEIQHNNRFSAPVLYGELQNQKKIVIVKGDKKMDMEIKIFLMCFFHYLFFHV